MPIGVNDLFWGYCVGESTEFFFAYIRKEFSYLKKYLKKYQKPIDNSCQLCYDIGIVRAAQKTNIQTSCKINLLLFFRICNTVRITAIGHRD